jgi:hypothetical protein
VAGADAVPADAQPNKEVINQTARPKVAA